MQDRGGGELDSLLRSTSRSERSRHSAAAIVMVAAMLATTVFAIRHGHDAWPIVLPFIPIVATLWTIFSPPFCCSPNS